MADSPLADSFARCASCSSYSAGSFACPRLVTNLPGHDGCACAYCVFVLSVLPIQRVQISRISVRMRELIQMAETWHELIRLTVKRN